MKYSIKNRILNTILRIKIGNSVIILPCSENFCQCGKTDTLKLLLNADIETNR